MKAKKKRKNGFKKFISTVVFTIMLCIGGAGLLLYNTFNFKGEVKDKYQVDSDFHTLKITSNHIVVKSWFGEKDFCVNDDLYSNIEIGKSYSFKKETVVDWVKLQDKQEEEMLGEKAEGSANEKVVEKPEKEEFKFI